MVSKEEALQAKVLTVRIVYCLLILGYTALLGQTKGFLSLGPLELIWSDLQCPPQLLAPLMNMSKTGYEEICLFCLSSWSFTQNIHKNLTFSLK